jgi:hypothetical protein
VELKLQIDRSVGEKSFETLVGGHPWLTLTITLSEGWYRYGDSNPGPVAENHVS